jgi:hypothetical protein
VSQCGDCDICCKVFDIHELDTPSGEYCRHCTGGACGIHEERPQVCRGYECAYLANDWNESLRPDKCGVVINNTPGDGYVALRFRDDVSPEIMQQIKFIEKNYSIQIHGKDARAGGNAEKIKNILQV